MRSRHSVRKYTGEPIEPEKREILDEEAADLSMRTGLAIRTVYDDLAVYKAGRRHYGSFSGCSNCIAIFGGPRDQEKAGYYGERMVLLAQSLGLGTCWTALTFEKSSPNLKAPEGKKLIIVIALGHPEDPGVPHKSKPAERISNASPDSPRWFIEGVEAALLAPTAINQQRFRFTLDDSGRVKAEKLSGPCADIDLGIVKYHFELGAGKENFEWTD
jgi:hypothetical protein